MENNRKYGGEKMVVRIKEKAIVMLSIITMVISEMVMLYKTNLENIDVMVISFLVAITSMFILSNVKIRTKKRPAQNLRK